MFPDNFQYRLFEQSEYIYLFLCLRFFLLARTPASKPNEVSLEIRPPRVLRLLRLVRLPPVNAVSPQPQPPPFNLYKFLALQLFLVVKELRLL